MSAVGQVYQTRGFGKFRVLHRRRLAHAVPFGVKQKFNLTGYAENPLKSGDATPSRNVITIFDGREYSPLTGLGKMTSK